MVHRIDKDRARMYNDSNNADNAEIDRAYPLISDYVDSFITIENFRSSYLGNNHFDDYVKLQHKISIITFCNVKSECKYIVYLECEMRDTHSVKVIFHTEHIYYTDPKLISLIRDKKINELV